MGCLEEITMEDILGFDPVWWHYIIFAVIMFFICILTNLFMRRYNELRFEVMDRKSKLARKEDNDDQAQEPLMSIEGGENTEQKPDISSTPSHHSVENFDNNSGQKESGTKKTTPAANKEVALTKEFFPEFTVPISTVRSTSIARKENHPILPQKSGVQSERVSITMKTLGDIDSKNESVTEIAKTQDEEKVKEGFIIPDFDANNPKLMIDKVVSVKSFSSTIIGYLNRKPTQLDISTKTPENIDSESRGICTVPVICPKRIASSSSEEDSSHQEYAIVSKSKSASEMRKVYITAENNMTCRTKSIPSVNNIAAFKFVNETCSGSNTNDCKMRNFTKSKEPNKETKMKGKDGSFISVMTELNDPSLCNEDKSTHVNSISILDMGMEESTEVSKIGLLKPSVHFVSAVDIGVNPDSAVIDDNDVKSESFKTANIEVNTESTTSPVHVFINENSLVEDASKSSYYSFDATNACNSENKNVNTSDLKVTSKPITMFTADSPTLSFRTLSDASLKTESKRIEDIALIQIRKEIYAAKAKYLNEYKEFESLDSLVSNVSGSDLD